MVSGCSILAQVKRIPIQHTSIPQGMCLWYNFSNASLQSGWNLHLWAPLQEVAILIAVCVYIWRWVARPLLSAPGCFFRQAALEHLQSNLKFLVKKLKSCYLQPTSYCAQHAAKLSGHYAKASAQCAKISLCTYICKNQNQQYLFVYIWCRACHKLCLC